MKLPAQIVRRLSSLAMLFLVLAAVSAIKAPASGQTNSSGAPDTFEALVRSATTAREGGQTESAIRDYQRAVAIHPDWAEGWWYLGSLQYDRDQYSDAISSFQKLTALAPQVGPAWNFLGLCEFETKNYNDALVHLEKGQALGSGDDPEIARVSAYHLALLRIRNSEFDPATQLLTSTFGKGRPSAQVKFALGLALLQIALLPDEVDPSREAMVQAAGEAAALEAQGDSSQALDALRALVKSYPDVPAAHLALAQALQASGKSAEAESERQVAKSLVVKEPASQTSSARQYARAPGVATGSTTSLAGDWNQAMSYYAIGKYAEAIAELKAFVQHKPQDGTAWAVMGLSEFELQDYSNALIHLQRGESLGFGGSPEAVQLANYTLGVLLNRQCEFKRASEVLTAAVGLVALDQKVRVALGMALLRMPVLPEQVDPSKQSLLDGAGAIAALLLQSKYDDAFVEFQALLKQYPAIPFLHYAYGVALASLSQYEEAQIQMREELAISPKSELPYLRLASIALRQHRPSDAVVPAQEALKLAPDSGEGHYLLGRAYLELGQTQGAVSELEAASKLSPESPEVHFNLAKAYAKVKLPEKAAAERAIFVRLNAAAEQQRSLHGSQSYEGPRDNGDVSVSHDPAQPASEPH